MVNLERAILKNLLNKQQEADFTRRVFPYLKSDYFEGEERLLFTLFADYYTKYTRLPNLDAIIIEAQASKHIDSDERLRDVCELADELYSGADTPDDPDWLLDQTEQWCRDRATYNAIMGGLSLFDDDSKRAQRGIILDELRDALNISFDSNLGHDYLEDADERFGWYHEVSELIPFDLEYLNKITNGGTSRKTLNVLVAGTGVGKSTGLCHLAAAWLKDGRNVTYISMEMSEKKVSARIDANLLNMSTKELKALPKASFDKKIAKLRAETVGKLIIKEYPTSQAHAGHFRNFLNEVSQKKSTKPDIIIVDYLNICASSRITKHSGDKYELAKYIAEELRGLAVEFDASLWTATQLNRSGYEKSDPDLTNTAESFGVPYTADLMLAMISTEEMESMGQIMFKQLKNRDGDANTHKKFVVGLTRDKFRLFDVDQSAQEGIDDQTKPDVQTKPVFGSEKSRKNMNFSKFKV
jgi:archaellum biogenesis ATPase FlaH